MCLLWKGGEEVMQLVGTDGQLSKNVHGAKSYLFHTYVLNGNVSWRRGRKMEKKGSVCGEGGCVYIEAKPRRNVIIVDVGKKSTPNAFPCRKDVTNTWKLRSPTLPSHIEYLYEIRCWGQKSWGKNKPLLLCQTPKETPGIYKGELIYLRNSRNSLQITLAMCCMLHVFILFI